MAVQKLYDATASIGTYVDRDGNEKNRYLKIGTVFKNTESGNMSMKLDGVPVGIEWNGWVSFFAPRPYEDKKGSKENKNRASDNQINVSRKLPF